MAMPKCSGNGGWTTAAEASDAASRLHGSGAAARRGALSSAMRSLVHALFRHYQALASALAGEPQHVAVQEAGVEVDLVAELPEDPHHAQGRDLPAPGDGGEVAVVERYSHFIILGLFVMRAPNSLTLASQEWLAIS